MIIGYGGGVVGDKILIKFLRYIAVETTESGQSDVPLCILGHRENLVVGNIVADDKALFVVGLHIVARVCSSAR